MNSNPDKEEHDFDKNETVFQYMAYLRFIRVLRPLAYSNEVGEAFRHNFPKLVKPLYGLSFCYIGMDIALDTLQAEPGYLRSRTLFDRVVWHSIASLALPGITVHKTVKTVTKLVADNSNIHLRRIAPVAVGLGIIPFIVHPIDEFTDFLMDSTIRKFY